MPLAQRYYRLIEDCREQSARLGRAPPCLIAVSKTRTAAEIDALAALGQIDFGENYVQEAVPKITALKTQNESLIWHFIGPIQSNKTISIATHFDWVHSLSRIDHAERLSRQRGALIIGNKLAPLNVCLQINTSAEKNKSGIAPSELSAFAAGIIALPHLCLRGLMALPSPLPSPLNKELAPALDQQGDSHRQLMREFGLMQELLADLQRQLMGRIEYPKPDVLSMGMSADWPIALSYGASHIRIGTQLFGARL